jgi:HK97 gp10 family phage protein
MSVDFDVSEILDLATDLETIAPKQMKNAVRSVISPEAAQMRDRARAGAPKDRPWLSTAKGIRKSMRTYPDAIVGSVFSTPDPEGRMVAVFVVYGTSVMAPQDFITPAMAGAEGFPEKVLAAIEPFSTSAGPDVGDDSDA